MRLHHRRAEPDQHRPLDKGGQNKLLGMASRKVEKQVFRRDCQGRYSIVPQQPVLVWVARTEDADVWSCLEKTHMMFRANIYIRQLDAVLERLKDSELKEFDDKTKTFLIIEKGGEFLELYKSMT